MGLLQLDPGLPVAERHGDSSLVLAVILLLPGDGVLVQVVDGVFLGFRIQGLGIRVGPYRREHLDARVRYQRQSRHDKNQQPRQQKILLGKGDSIHVSAQG